MSCRDMNFSYSEPTPTWRHSYGFDHEGHLRRADELQSRRHQIMTSRLREVHPLGQQWEQLLEANPTGVPESRLIRGASDPSHHNLPWETQSHGVLHKSDPSNHSCPINTQSRVVLDVSDSSNHSCPWRTQLESQEYGWFADARRHPKCRLREWPQNYSFCW